jgi:4-hydroxy-2-oxoheptanedioate aldolase
MPAPTNTFKASLTSGKAQIGLWLGLGTANTAELAATAGFDWLLVDGEHGPSDVPLILAQLQAIAASGSHPVVRPPIGETWLIKQLLDIGAQTLLVPMVETAAQAEQLVRATRYPPHGVRGVGAALARASAYNGIPDYLTTANDQICLLVQVESVAAMAQIEAIAAVDGVDGIFIGPSDLAADMGHLGKPGAPEVQAAVDHGIARIIAAGKPAGILTADMTLAHHYIALGASFVAVGTDVTTFASALRSLARQFAPATTDKPQSGSAGY